MQVALSELRNRSAKLKEALKNCHICPRKCGANRISGEIGVCRIGSKARVSSYGLHFGEESVLVGGRGSGTVFFAGCPLRCMYCQNYDISQLCHGYDVDIRELGEIFLEIERMGALNLNLVTPTHVVPMIVEALEYALERGFSLPIVYNTGGYDSIETLKLLDGIVDIYMPDVKYAGNEVSRKYSLCPDYWDVVRMAIKEMHRQVGDLVIKEGIATKGLLVRHLVLPHRLAGSFEVLDFLKSVSPNTAVNIMDQYYPAYRAFEYPELKRRITKEEYEEVLIYALRLGLRVIR